MKLLPFDRPLALVRAVHVSATKGVLPAASLFVAVLVLLLTPVPSVPRAEAERLDDSAWLLVRSRLPLSAAVLQPAWLPVAFQSAPVVQYAGTNKDEGPIYLVGYRASQNTLLFALGPVNSAPPDRIEHITVRGVPGILETTRGWPSVGVYWQEGGYHYSVAATGLDRADIIRIVGELRPVPSSSAGSEASPTTVGLPRTGGAPIAYRAMLVLGIVICGAGWLMRGTAERQ